MPFTFSHPAIVLPFLKNRKMSATALIVGAMSPDLEYFFRMKTESEMSHTFLGVFLVDFPLGFIVIYAFHQIIKVPLIANLPVFFQKRMQVLKETDWLVYFRNNRLTVFVSFFLGTVSHFFLDSMTHWDGFLVQRIPFLSKIFLGIAVYDIAQYLSSIVGLWLIWIYFCKQPQQDSGVEKIDFRYWSFSMGLAAIIFSVRYLFGSPLTEIGSVIVSVLFPMMLAVTIAGFFFRKKWMLI